MIGCGDDAATTPRSTRDMLSEARAFTVVDSTARLRATIDRGSRSETTEVALTVADGSFEASAEGEGLWLDELAIAIDDVALPLSIFPAQLTLTEVGVRLTGPTLMPASWSDDDQTGTMLGRCALAVEWSLRVGDATYPLAPQEIDGLGVSVAVAGRDDDLELQLALNAKGVMWTWSDIVALGDLDLRLTGVARAD